LPARPLLLLLTSILLTPGELCQTSRGVGASGDRPRKNPSDLRESLGETAAVNSNGEIRGDVVSARRAGGQAGERVSAVGGDGGIGGGGESDYGVLARAPACCSYPRWEGPKLLLRKI
jgi:hypothetical protein